MPLRLSPQMCYIIQSTSGLRIQNLVCTFRSSLWQNEGLTHELFLLERFMHDSTERRSSPNGQKPAFWTEFQVFFFLFLLDLWTFCDWQRQRSGNRRVSVQSIRIWWKFLASFLFPETLDRDRSFGKNGLDQGYFLVVSARIEHTWTISIQTAQDISKRSEGNLQSDITRYYHLQRTLTWAQAMGRCWSLRWRHKRENCAG